MNPGSNRVLTLTIASFAVVALFYLLREHWGHALGFLPYLLLLACPLLHLFHGHGGHGRDEHETHRQQSGAKGRAETGDEP